MAVARCGNSTEPQDPMVTDPNVQVPPVVPNSSMAAQPPHFNQLPGGLTTSQTRLSSYQSNDGQILPKRPYDRTDQFQGLPRDEGRREDLPIIQSQSRSHSRECYPDSNEDSATSHPSEGDDAKVRLPHNDPFLITAQIGNMTVSRFMIDNEASSNILFKSTYEKM
uniref:Uncharacterized protein n=1 Tax=Cannabis sativa TaxID=3483 RepID=A0A803P527_CANSA